MDTTQNDQTPRTITRDEIRGIYLGLIRTMQDVSKVRKDDAAAREAAMNGVFAAADALALLLQDS